MARFQGKVRDEGGYTLPELLMGMIIGLLVTTAAATLVVSMVRAQPAVAERAGQVQQGRVLLERITRELRQGESILNASGSQLSLLTYVRSDTCGGSGGGSSLLCRVDYACTTTACTRTEREPSGNAVGSTTIAIEGLGSANVFSTPSGADPAYVQVTLVFPQDEGQEAVTLADGASLRNYFATAPG